MPAELQSATARKYGSDPPAIAHEQRSRIANLKNDMSPEAKNWVFTPSTQRMRGTHARCQHRPRLPGCEVHASVTRGAGSGRRLCEGFGVDLGQVRQVLACAWLHPQLPPHAPSALRAFRVQSNKKPVKLRVHPVSTEIMG
jgi:hypothetical protein